MNKFYVIARSQLQGHTWISSKRVNEETFNGLYPNRTDCIVVTRPEHLRGCNVEHGILLEGWREIQDIEEILFLAMIHSQGQNPALRKAYELVKPKVRPTPKKTISGTTYNNAIQQAADELAKAIDDGLVKSIT